MPFLRPVDQEAFSVIFLGCGSASEFRVKWFRMWFRVNPGFRVGFWSGALRFRVQPEGQPRVEPPGLEKSLRD